jgi:hypothetical protein
MNNSLPMEATFYPSNQAGNDLKSKESTMNKEQFKSSLYNSEEEQMLAVGERVLPSYIRILKKEKQEKKMYEDMKIYN